MSYAYQWLRCNQDECTDIDYANANPYTLPWGLVGLQAEVTVTATDAQGDFGFATSEMTDAITYNGPSYTVSESTIGAGSVTGYVTGPATSRTADANLSCPGACGALYPYVAGTEVELSATPVPGSTFLGWGGACSGSAPTCSLTLGNDVAATATFSGQATISPVLPLWYEQAAGEAQPSSAGAPSRGAWEPSASSATGRGLPAHLLGIHYRRHHIQAEVRCQQARPCRLSLAIFAGASTSQAMIAQRSFTVASRRSARISLALNRAGERILARRHRPLVTTRLTLRRAGRASLIEQGRFAVSPRSSATPKMSSATRWRELSSTTGARRPAKSTPGGGTASSNSPEPRAKTTCIFRWTASIAAAGRAGRPRCSTTATPRRR